MKTPMKTPLSPNDIEVLLWCHCRPEPHPSENGGARGLNKSHIMWEAAGMIEMVLETDTKIWHYRTTDKGGAMINALCNTPEPQCAWIDEVGNTLLVSKT